MKSIARRLIGVLVACGIALSAAAPGLAGDMDDKIDRDDGFEFDNTLKKETNIKYVKEKAKAKARQQGQDPDAAAAGGGTNINSAVVGGNVYGDIIIIDEGKGDKTVVK